jgi:hypothetical protein
VVTRPWAFGREGAFDELVHGAHGLAEAAMADGDNEAVGVERGV